jgi:hypothetical protein
VESLTSDFKNGYEANKVVDPIAEAKRKLDAEAAKHFPEVCPFPISRLLDEKRKKHGIPLSAFTSQPMFDQVLIWQVPVDSSKTYGSGLIEKTDQTLRAELVEAPRGVIVSAGLTALDQLACHGAAVGHTIYFYQIAPLRMRLPAIGGKQPSLVMIQARYVFGSEELAEGLRSRAVRVIAKDNAEGITEHFYCDENAKMWKPIDVQTEDG